MKPKYSTVVLISLAVGLAFIVFAVFGKVTRKARVHGVLVPLQGALTLTSSIPGIFSQQKINEGDFVKVGTPLFVLNTDRAIEQGSAAAIVELSLQQRKISLQTEQMNRELQLRQRESALNERIRVIENEISQAEKEVVLNERRVQFAKKTVISYQKLADDGFVSVIQSQNKQEELLDQQMREEAARRGVISLRKERHALKTELITNRSQLTTDSAQIDRSIAQVEQEIAENQGRKSVVINAPDDGIVSTIQLSLGSSVQAGQVIGIFIPTTEDARSKSVSKYKLQAQLFAPSRMAGFIKIGQPVLLRYSAFPYQKFGSGQGIIEDISHTPIAPQDLPNGQSAALLAAAQANEPLYRIQVGLKRQEIDAFGEVHQLKPGMSIEADIVQETRSVWEWLLEPALAMHKKIQI